MFTRAAAMFAAALLLPGGAAAQDVFIDFEAMSPGDSVEGLGALHPNLDIKALCGKPQTFISMIGDEDGVDPAAAKPDLGLRLLCQAVQGIVIESGDFGHIGYSATASEGQSIPNNCLEDSNGRRIDRISGRTARGFTHAGAHAAGTAQEFAFGFGGRTVSRFEIRMLDFGDHNAQLATDLWVKLQAYDSEGKLLAVDDLKLDSCDVAHDYCELHGNLAVSGDACSALEGQPGYRLFMLQGEGIAHITLTLASGADPDVGFDSIRFTLEE